MNSTIKNILVVVFDLNEIEKYSKIIDNGY